MCTYHGLTFVWHSVLYVKALVGAFNQEKVRLGAFSVITNIHVDLCFKLQQGLRHREVLQHPPLQRDPRHLLGRQLQRAGAAPLLHQHAGLPLGDQTVQAPAQG